MILAASLVKITALNAPTPQIVLFAKVDSSYKTVIASKLVITEHMAMVTPVTVSLAVVTVNNAHLPTDVPNAIQPIFSGKANARNVKLVNHSLTDNVSHALNHVKHAMVQVKRVVHHALKDITWLVQNVSKTLNHVPQQHVNCALVTRKLARNAYQDSIVYQMVNVSNVLLIVWNVIVHSLARSVKRATS
jgi:hypothetical protein